MNNPKELTILVGPAAKKEGKYPVKHVQLPTVFLLIAYDYVKEGPLSNLKLLATFKLCIHAPKFGSRL